MWIVFALLVRLIWAGTNAVDQVLARVHPKHNVLAAMTIQYMCFLPFAGIGYFLASPFTLHAPFIFYCLGAILGMAIGGIPYFIALRREEAYNVTPYLELTPVFLIGFAYLFKHETLTATQLAGAAIIIASGFLFSWDFAHGRFKTSIFLLLASSSLAWATYQFCVSQAEPLAGMWGIDACYYLGMSCIGFTLFATHKEVRETILTTFTRTRGNSALLAFATNILDISGLAVLLLAFRYAPTIGHVAAVSGAQPIFSFLLTLPLARLYPQHFAQATLDLAALGKLTLIFFIFFGVYLLAG